MTSTPQTAKELIPQKSLDYLIIGHLTGDLQNNGTCLGGTAAYAGLTGQALGFNTGLVTAFSRDLDISPVESLWIHALESADSTTFENISNGGRRSQYLYHIATRITQDDLPKFPYPIPIVHLAPVANEVDQGILDFFPNSLKCLTPQGWLRKRGENNRIETRKWEERDQTLASADIAVLSLEDVQGDENLIAEIASILPVLAVTENEKGARIYWHNDARYFKAPEVKYLSDTGAGDIFAAAFFYRYHQTHNPWEAGRFAVQLASCSVTRAGLESIPKNDEIRKATIEIL